VKALSRRDHSAASLRAKLERAGVSAGAREAAVDRLVRDGYVDDAQYARQRAGHLAGRGYGDAWIRGDLDTQGIPADVSEGALATLEPERDRASRHAERLGGGLAAAQKLLRRGFAEESLEAIVALPLRATPEQE
jgi:SOS response regulatory protein OraA/RecX